LPNSFGIFILKRIWYGFVGCITFIWAMMIFGLLNPISTLPHCGSPSFLSGTFFLFVVAVQGKVSSWWPVGLQVQAPFSPTHINSLDKWVQLFHGIGWFGSSGPYLSTVSFCGWLLWVNSALGIDCDSTLLIPPVCSIGRRKNLTGTYSFFVDGHVNCGIWSQPGCG
jgi:hypothetical protein